MENIFFSVHETCEPVKRVGNRVVVPVVADKLVELSLPIPEVCGSNPVISKVF